jgi:antitoxin component of RelBE/YafQ-DinJ toxin-antitoxin module
MNNTILQIPMPLELREKSEKVANDLGFSSLQEAIRVFLKKFSQKEIVVSFDIPQVKLSAKNEKRYLKIVEDYKNNKNIVRTNTTKDFFDKLNSD